MRKHDWFNFDTHPVVCVTHMREAPCDACFTGRGGTWSTRQEDIQRIQEHHNTLKQPEGMTFYLGTNMPAWLRTSTHPLFVSHKRLQRYHKLPEASCDWALDSGGFTEIKQHGTWTITPREYVQAVKRYENHIGRLQWCAPQDWMCEPQMLAKTGLSIRQHQHNTVNNYLELAAHDIPVIPVLQGWEHDDYQHCIDLYNNAGIDLTKQPVVGLGSVCRRQNTNQIRNIVTHLHGQGLKLHGFGVKTRGLHLYANKLTSSDSMAWSYQGSWQRPCPQTGNKTCSGCWHYAIEWRNKLLTNLQQLSHTNT